MKEALLLCPSAQPAMEGCRVLGVMMPNADQPSPMLAYLDRPVPATPDVLALTGALQATEVLRLAAPCEQQRCQHFEGQRCQLATRVVQILPAVVDTLPACAIRLHCRWFHQEGKQACLRCPQVATVSYHPSEEWNRVAGPSGIMPLP